MVRAKFGPPRRTGGKAASREPVDTDDKVRDFQLLAWFKVSGQEDIVALSGRYVELALWVQNLNAENGAGDADTLRPVCAGPVGAVRRAHAGIR